MKLYQVIEAAERAIEIDPQNTGPWAYKAHNLRHLGWYEEAVSEIDRGVEIDPNYGGGWYEQRYLSYVAWSYYRTQCSFRQGQRTGVYGLILSPISKRNCRSTPNFLTGP